MLAFSIFLLAVGIGTVIGGHLRFTFFPHIPGDRLNMSFRMAFGTPLPITQAAQDRLFDAAQSLIKEYEEKQGHPIVNGIWSRIGGRNGSHVASIKIYFKPEKERGFATREFSSQWRKRVGSIAGAETLSFRSGHGPGGGSDLNIRVSHPDPTILNTLVGKISHALTEYPGVSNIEDSRDSGKSEIQLQLRPEATSLGLSISEVTQQIGGAFQGIEVLKFQRGKDEVKVMLRYPFETRKYLKNLENFIIRTPSGTQVPLSQIALLQSSKGSSQIVHEDGIRVITVGAAVDSNIANVEEITDSLKAGTLVPAKQDYPRFEYTLAGRHDRRSSVAGIYHGGIYTLLVIFGLLALQFRSYFQPFIVMLAIPFGVIGAIAGHWIHGFDLSFISMLGIVALSGIVVNDSLIFVDFVNNGRKKGMALADAVTYAGLRRFRPIMLTSLTTFVGIMPMILESDRQARFLIPMALSLGYGIMAATFITLLLIPALYLILEDILSLFRYLYGDPPLKETNLP